MEPDFHTTLNTFPAFPAVNAPETSFYGIESIIGAPQSTPDLVGFGYFGEDLTSFHDKQLIELPIDEGVRCSIFEGVNLKLPKHEPIDEEQLVISTFKQNRHSPIDVFNYRDGNTVAGLKICSTDYTGCLPDLRSLEQISNHEDEGVSNKRMRFSSTSVARSASKTFDDVVKNLSISNPSSSCKPLPLQTLAPNIVIPHNTLARKRRKKISERTRCLEKLMPWDKKMDIAKMLQEAHKYIRFLEAQVSVLQSMPLESSGVLSNQNQNQVSNGLGGEFSGLEKLNRQQLLQVLLNSRVVQEKLYSSESCIFSVEQIGVLKQALVRKLNSNHTMQLGSSKTG